MEFGRSFSFCVGPGIIRTSLCRGFGHGTASTGAIGGTERQPSDRCMRASWHRATAKRLFTGCDAGYMPSIWPTDCTDAGFSAGPLGIRCSIGSASFKSTSYNKSPIHLELLMPLTSGARLGYYEIIGLIRLRASFDGLFFHIPVAGPDQGHDPADYGPTQPKVDQ